MMKLLIKFFYSWCNSGGRLGKVRSW